MMCEYLGVLATVQAREFWMCLKSIYLGSRKVKVQRVTVVELECTIEVAMVLLS